MQKQDLLRHSLNHFPPALPDVHFLTEKMASRLLDRLSFVHYQPARILNIGAGLGSDASLLQTAYPEAHITALDIASQRLASGQYQHSVCADMHALPFENQAFDLIYTNAALHWSETPSTLFNEIARTLKPGGILAFTTLGQDSFQELRTAFSQLDPYTHLYPFTDIHPVGDQLLKAGFQDPVLDREYLRITYSTLPKLLKELQTAGEPFLGENRRKGLMTPRQLTKLDTAYPRGPDGLYTVTIELICGFAWGTVTKPVQQQQADGAIHIPIDSIKMFQPK